MNVIFQIDLWLENKPFIYIQLLNLMYIYNNNKAEVFHLVKLTNRL
jgi:hypothetical protein